MKLVLKVKGDCKFMTQRIFLSFLFICLLMSCSQAEDSAEYVNIPDEKLAEVLRHELELSPLDPILKKELSELTELRIGYFHEIKNLKGLEHATGLTDFRISGSYENKDLSLLYKVRELSYLLPQCQQHKTVGTLNTTYWVDPQL